MALSLKIAASGMVLAIAVGALDRFLHWMNQASDVSLYGAGLFGAMCLVVLVPAVLGLIWKVR